MLKQLVSSRTPSPTANPFNPSHFEINNYFISNFSDQCQGTKSLPSSGGRVTLQNPHYPDGTPAVPGLHCNWSITAPKTNSNTGFIMVTFKEVNTDGSFNITVGNHAWRFQGTSGLESLSTEINSDHIRIRYDCPSRRISRKFKIQVSWEEIDGNCKYINI